VFGRGILVLGWLLGLSAALKEALDRGFLGSSRSLAAVIWKMLFVLFVYMFVGFLIDGLVFAWLRPISQFAETWSLQGIVGMNWLTVVLVVGVMTLVFGFPFNGVRRCVPLTVFIFVMAVLHVLGLTASLAVSSG
jgi:hypothetical protein